MNSNQKRITEGFLYTDQYQLTMAQVYYRHGLHTARATFDYFFRSYPDYGAHKAGYCINAGLEWLVGWMHSVSLQDDELELLRGQKNNAGRPLFAPDFLNWLKASGNYENIDLRAVPEGRVVHPGTPLAVVEGPLALAQLLETPLLNHLTYPTLIATKASRMRESGQGRQLLEFGLRRAHGLAANAGARAALIGGADFSSNVGISHVLGFPPKGTHAHSLVQVFIALGGTELDAFRAFAEIYPDDCILLVDTINTLESGIPNAIIVFEELKRRGHTPLGIRLDSGDLAYLSIQAARMLDASGFPAVRIVLSNQLDELVIWQIVTQIRDEAPRYGVEADAVINRLVYGIGTSLITSQGDGALDGVYKLTAVENRGEWLPTLKLSESSIKTTNPGSKRLWRIYDARGKASADLIALADETIEHGQTITLRDPNDEHKWRVVDAGACSEVEELHVQVTRAGALCYEFPDIPALRRQRDADLERLDPGVKRLLIPHEYHVSVSARLWALKQELVQKAAASHRGNGEDE
ncbi:MAG: nicotinate phosphoribosyltransferase [Chloroflexi bacterium]|nr:nicotinate phosphoribosyltransferase [Chloroflexota bacterium]